MEVQQALSDLAEVRGRLAHLQRFEGYSGFAAAASGLVALGAGVLQLQLAPHPQSAEQLHLYILIWLTCLAAALTLNYGSALAWAIRQRGPRAQSQFRSAALTILPSIFLGGALSTGLVEHGAFTLLPGMWFACYAIGLFASREMIPRPVMLVALAFAGVALTFLMTPLEAVALSWWVMPLGFGIGQVAIGALILRDVTQR